MSDDEPLNPYASPESVDDGGEAENAVIFRRGDNLVCGTFARLAPICLASGVPTTRYVTHIHSWHPAWVYMLSIPGVIPYLLFASFFSHTFALRVPVGEDVWRRHLRRANIGFIGMLTGGGMLVIAILIASTSGGSDLASFLLLTGVVVGLFGFWLGSRHPIQLNVVSVEKGRVELRGVHPKCLEGLPEA